MRKNLSRMGRIIRDITVFGMLAAILTTSKFAISYLPNIEPVSMLIAVYTIVYRQRALIPIYVFVMVEGIIYGMFTPHFVMYLYVWTILWALVMLVTCGDRFHKMPILTSVLLSVTVTVFGLAFGTLCAPVQSFMYGFSMESTLIWIANGLPWDIAHAVGNAVISILIFPLTRLLLKLEKR